MITTNCIDAVRGSSGIEPWNLRSSINIKHTWAGDCWRRAFDRNSHSGSVVTDRDRLFLRVCMRTCRKGCFQISREPNGRYYGRCNSQCKELNRNLYKCFMFSCLTDDYHWFLPSDCGSTAGVGETTTMRRSYIFTTVVASNWNGFRFIRNAKFDNLSTIAMPQKSLIQFIRNAPYHPPYYPFAAI